jgi:hypothetical protein
MVMIVVTNWLWIPALVWFDFALRRSLATSRRT